jgi:hypothetical protein
MSSNINPNNIDGTYPVAGQDNDSQGFRDNFTNTKTNFTYAADEITDLQNKAVLKAALTGTTLNNDMGGSILSNAQLQDMSESKVSLGTVTGNQTVNFAAGSYYTLTTSGSVSLSFTNPSASGTLSRWRVQITVSNINHTMSVTAATNMVGTSNIQGYVAVSAASGTVTFNKTGTYEFEFETSDGGSNISMFDLNRNRDPIFLPSYEDVASAGACSLTKTVSGFTTAGAETATLAAGYEGQIKILIGESVVAGNMVVTVTNPGWKASGTGTITFTNAGYGQSVILMYINSAWYVISTGPDGGNNYPVLA